MQDCQVTVVKVGTTANLFWELRQAFEVHPFKPVLICMPQAEQGSITNTQQRYERFKKALGLELPRTACKLPRELGATGYFLFNRPDSIVEFDGLTGTFPLELLENLRPGTLEPLFNEINAKNRRARKANLIGSVVVLAMGASIILFVIYALVFG